MITFPNVYINTIVFFKMEREIKLFAYIMIIILIILEHIFQLLNLGSIQSLEVD